MDFFYLSNLILQSTTKKKHFSIQKVKVVFLKRNLSVNSIQKMVVFLNCL